MTTRERPSTAFIMIMAAFGLVAAFFVYVIVVQIQEQFACKRWCTEQGGIIVAQDPLVCAQAQDGKQVVIRIKS